MTARVLVTCPQMQAGIHRHRAVLEAAGVEIDLPTVVQQLDEEALLAVIDRYDGMIAGDDELTARVLARAGRLRVISKWGVGIDNIDLDAARRLGIHVTNTPGAFAAEVADVCVGYLVLLARRLHHLDREVRGGRWTKHEGLSLQGRTIGIIGLGAIGLALGRRASAMEMHVLGFDVAPAQVERGGAIGVDPADMAELLMGSDFVSLNCSLTADNRHLLAGPELAMMKHGSYLINTSRGALVDEAALVEALSSGRIAGAALDVFEEEPLPEGHPLLKFEQCIFGTHNSSNTTDGVVRASELAVENLLAGLHREARS